MIAANQVGKCHFRLLSPCSACSTAKVKCSMEINCSACRNSGGHCEMSGYELINRAKRMLQLVHGNMATHSDVCKYQINMQCLVQGFVPIISRVDSKDIYTRIMDSRIVDTICVGDTKCFEMPTEMAELMYSSKHWKVEYMRDGNYTAVTSDEYDDAIMSFQDAKIISSKAKVPIKLVDTCGFNDFGIVYKMWCESVAYPMATFKYTGPGLWKSDGVVCYMTMRMMSAIVSPTIIITTTVMSRGQVFVL